MDTADTANPKKIPLAEPIFGPTIQGEGALIGVQTYFVRLGLCDYKCKMCDSMHAVDPYMVKANAEWLTNLELFERLLVKSQDRPVRWVTLTGGNPCMHSITDFIWRSRQMGFKFALETQGTIVPLWLDQMDHITISPKGPGMGERFEQSKFETFIWNIQNSWDTIPRSCIKIVVFDQRDLDFAREVFNLVRGKYGYSNDQLFLSLGNETPPEIDGHSPVSQGELIHTMLNNYRVLFEDIQQDIYLSQVRFLPQWHCMVWGNDKGH